jgi:hypothetical protein
VARSAYAQSPEPLLSSGKGSLHFYDINDLDDITTRFRVDRPRDLSLPFRYNSATG